MSLMALHDMASEIGLPSRLWVGCAGAWLDSDTLIDSSEMSNVRFRWRGTAAIIFSTTLPCSVA